VPAIAVAQDSEELDYLDAVIENVTEEAKDPARVHAFRLKHAQAERAMIVVRDALGLGEDGEAAEIGPVKLGIDSDTNTLLLFGRDVAVKAVRGVLEQLDGPSESPDHANLKMFVLQNANCRVAHDIVHAMIRDQGPYNLAVDERTNTLIVRTAPQQLEIVEAILQRLDSESAVRSVHVEVVIGQLLGDPAEVLHDFQSVHGLRIPATADVELVLDDLIPTIVEAGVISKPIRLSGTTLDRNRMELHVGFKHAVIHGTTIRNQMRNNAVNYQNVGTIVSLDPTLTADGVQMKLELENSRMGPADSGTVVSESGDGEELRIPAIATNTFSSSLMVPTGKAVVFAIINGSDDSVDHGLLIAIRATVE
jgi:type II secretory pathway component GspD/PulD (secretin)